MYFLIELAMILIFFFIWRSSSRSVTQTPESAGDDQGISIIVPAYNEELTIVDVVEMLGESDYSEFEIIASVFLLVLSVLPFRTIPKSVAVCIASSYSPAKPSLF